MKRVERMFATSGNVLLKHDVESGAVEEQCFEHRAAGEPMFAPRSLSAGEDEGYVMAFAHDVDGGSTDLVILAAQDFAGEPVPRVHLPVRVPLGLHGSWIADSWALLLSSRLRLRQRQDDTEQAENFECADPSDALRPIPARRASRKLETYVSREPQFLDRRLLGI